MLVYLIHSRFKIACMQHKCVWTRYDITRFHIQKLISATVRHNLMRAVYICTYLYTHVVVVLASSTIVASGNHVPRVCHVTFAWSCQVPKKWLRQWHVLFLWVVRFPRVLVRSESNNWNQLIAMHARATLHEFVFYVKFIAACVKF